MRRRGKKPRIVAPAAPPEVTFEEAGRIADELRYVLNFAEHMVNSLASGLDAVRVRSMAPEADQAIRAVLAVLKQADKTIRDERNSAHHAICQRALDEQRKTKGE